MDAIWVLICGFMVLDMQAGFLCLEAGLARAKNASNVALKNVSDICMAALCYWLVGFGLMFGVSFGGVFGTSWFAPGATTTALDIAPFLFFQLAFASTAVTIVSGAVAERASFAAYLGLSVVMAALIYPVVGHAIWGGAFLTDQNGWLAALGFMDFAGATVVHSVGGWTALVFCIFLGPRLGRFARAGRRSRRFDPSSMSQAALGIVFLWIGWAGFNAGSALAYDESVGPIVLRTMIGAASGGATAMLASYLLWSHPSAHLTLNGVIAGLVAGTAGIHVFTTGDAAVAGALGTMSMLLARFAIAWFRIDDVVDAVPVHLAPGILGTLLVAMLGDPAALSAGGRLDQLAVQALGVVAVAVWTVSAASLALWAIGRVGRLRVRAREELVGLDTAEHHIGNAFLDLVEEMKSHQRTGRFSSRVTVDASTEVGMVAYRYNRVLDRVEAEIAARMAAVKNERQMRQLIADSYSALEEAQKESVHAARHDRLTGLGNRLLLDEIAGGVGDGSQATLLVIAIDLDRFKSINDRHGHDAGDAVLRATAERIRSVLRAGRDFGFRIGGDEFVVLLDWEGSTADPQDMCDVLRTDLTAKVPFGVLQLEPGASIGYTLYRAGAQSLNDSLRQADMALYRAKHGGRNDSIAYSVDIGSTYTAHLEELEFFKNAFARNEIFPMFQPQIDAATDRVIGCEVLARWNHPRRGVVTPDHFLSLAEELNLLAELDGVIFDRALDAHQALQSKGIVLQNLSVNVSARRLDSPDLLRELRARPLLPPGLAFEILETAHLDTLDADLSSTMSALKEMGIRIEVDDFGTGHASLASILALRPDALKIDRMFVSGIDVDPDRRELMRALLEMASRLGAETVVEGVETADHVKTLVSLGAGRLQGFYYTRPLPLESFLSWLEARADGSRAA